VFITGFIAVPGSHFIPDILAYSRRRKKKKTTAIHHKTSSNLAVSRQVAFGRETDPLLRR
jgi:hypothetical protein